MYINNAGHMTKMTTTPIYGINPSKIFTGTPELKTWHAASVTKVLQCVYKSLPFDDLDLFCLVNGCFRDIYYQDPDLFVSQNILDGIVDNLSCMLNVPRWDLHIVSLYDLSC